MNVEKSFVKNIKINNIKLRPTKEIKASMEAEIAEI
jgi:hypothetical protein